LEGSNPPSKKAYANGDDDEDVLLWFEVDGRATNGESGGLPVFVLLFEGDNDDFGMLKFQKTRSKKNSKKGDRGGHSCCCCRRVHNNFLPVTFLLLIRPNEPGK